MLFFLHLFMTDCLKNKYVVGAKKYMTKLTFRYERNIKENFIYNRQLGFFLLNYDKKPMFNNFVSKFIQETLEDHERKEIVMKR